MRYELWLRSPLYQWIPISPNTGDFKNLTDVWTVILHHAGYDEITGVAIVEHKPSRQQGDLKTIFGDRLEKQIAYWQKYTAKTETQQ